MKGIHSTTNFGVAVRRLEAEGADREAMKAVIENAAVAEDSDIAALALVLARSGRVRRSRKGTCDVISTGGPSSLSTLLCPLFLVAFGFTVPRVTVPGRPAGALDALGSMPNYKVRFARDQFDNVVAKAGFCQALASEDLAPLDGALFSLRKEVGAVGVTPLVIASLLAKKLAVGVETVLLEVRVGDYGNFGHSMTEAEQRAVRFCRVAQLLKIRASCILTRARQPYQPHIGRGEALVAVNQILFGKPSRWLRDHANLCFRIAREAVGVEVARPNRKVLRRIFEAHLAAQGTSAREFQGTIEAILSQRKHTICARATGYVVPDLDALRNIIVAAQQSAAPGVGEFPDPLGVQLLYRPSWPVRLGEAIAEVRHQGSALHNGTEADLRICFATSRQAIPGSVEVANVRA